MIRRREVITLLGGAVVWPLAARAQQPGKLPAIGFLGSDAAAWRPWVAAFAKRLRELGWMEGRTVTIQYRWSEGRRERFAEIAAEFVRLNVDVIVANGSAASTVKQATSVIPIVFVLAIDPVNSGLVASLPRPGGNITGLSNQQSDLTGKRLQLLREVVPGLRRLAIIVEAGFPEGTLEVGNITIAARALGLEVVSPEIRRAEDIAPAFAMFKTQADALYVVDNAFVVANRARITAFALSAHLPMIASNREIAQAGALISYGPNYSAIFRRAAEFVDKILRGARPADIPVEQPTKFELVLNLTTAEAIGLTVPSTLRALADEVIE